MWAKLTDCDKMFPIMGVKLERVGKSLEQSGHSAVWFISKENGEGYMLKRDFGSFLYLEDSETYNSLLVTREELVADFDLADIVGYEDRKIGYRHIECG